MAKHLSYKKWMRRVENLGYNLQVEEVEKEFGPVNINLGWGVSADLGYLSIASKVYTDPVRVIQTDFNYPSLEPETTWENY